MSKLYFRYSAMNAGKSTTLLQIAHNYEERGMSVTIVKPSADTKGDDKIVSRLGVERKVDLLVNENTDILKEIRSRTILPNAILVDESQFLTTKHVDQLMSITIELQIPVICYGLRTDFKTDGFEGSTRLLLIAHSVEELKTICRCGSKAIFNARKVNGEFVFDGNQVEIDNQEQVEYESLCAECYHRYKNGFSK